MPTINVFDRVLKALTVTQLESLIGAAVEAPDLATFQQALKERPATLSGHVAQAIA